MANPLMNRYKLFTISKNGEKHIKDTLIAKSKATEPESLFDSDAQIDPNFGNFDLVGHGVHVGDTITYTPTDTDVVVAENNMVICDGELMSLAQFTAKHMPRNKRSISGVCQGPKYFSFNGISLYKLKESFLGGQKNK